MDKNKLLAYLSKQIFVSRNLNPKEKFTDLKNIKKEDLKNSVSIIFDNDIANKSDSVYISINFYIPKTELEK